MKKILLPLTPLLLLASQGDLESKLNTLQNEVKQLKKDMKYHQDDLDERMPIIEKIETKSILDKLNLSPELDIRIDKFNFKNNSIDGEDTLIYEDGEDSGLLRRQNYSKHYDPSGYIRFRLNINAKLDDKVKFNARMIFANSTQSYQRVCILSRDIKSNTGSSAFDIDKAYFDFTPNKDSDYPFTLSFGLLPTTGGTPMQFSKNERRKSMFPSLVFDMNTYGFIATQKLASDTYIRAIVAKAYTLRDVFYPYQCNRENIDNATILGVYSDSTFDIFQADSLLSFGVNLLKDFKAHPYLGPDVNAENADVLGDIFTLGLGLDIKNIKQSGLTLFAHTAISNPHPNGKSDDYQIDPLNPKQEQTIDGNVGFSVAPYAKGEMISSNGYSYYVGAKYSISKNLNIGGEYNHGSKYWFGATQGAEDMYNKLATRGNAIEIYTNWMFHKNLYAKIGYMRIEEEYTGSGWHFGEPASKDAIQQIPYLNISAKF